MSHTVLIHTTNFPPDSGGRSARLRARVKYLSKIGWDSAILITSTSGKPMKITIDGESYIVYRNPNNISTESDMKTNSLIPSPIRRVLRKSLIPDHFITSLPQDIWNIWRIQKKEDVDVIYTMCFPFSHHLVGYVAQKLTGLPWVAEFRDPWVTNPNHFDGESGIANKFLEHRVVATADQVVYNYGIQVPENYFENQYLNHSQKITRLECPGSCGFDFDRLQDDVKSFEKFTIVYGGSFYEGHSPEMFFEGLRNFLNKFDVEPRDVRAEFYGDWKPEFNERLSELHLKNVVNHHGWIDPDAFLDELQRSHVALFIVRPFSGDELNVPQKVVEYAACRTPMLVLAPSEWEAVKFTNERGIGIIADPNDPDSIGNAIKQLYDTYHKGTLDQYTADDEVLSQFDAEYQAGQFASVLEAALGARST